MLQRRGGRRLTRSSCIRLRCSQLLGQLCGALLLLGGCRQLHAELRHRRTQALGLCTSCNQRLLRSSSPLLRLRQFSCLAFHGSRCPGCCSLACCCRSQLQLQLLDALPLHICLLLGSRQLPAQRLHLCSRSAAGLLMLLRLLPQQRQLSKSRVQLKPQLLVGGSGLLLSLLLQLPQLLLQHRCLRTCCTKLLLRLTNRKRLLLQPGMQSRAFCLCRRKLLLPLRLRLSSLAARRLLLLQLQQLRAQLRCLLLRCCQLGLGLGRRCSRLLLRCSLHTQHHCLPNHLCFLPLQRLPLLINRLQRCLKLAALTLSALCCHTQGRLTLLQLTQLRLQLRRGGSNGSRRGRCHILLHSRRCRRGRRGCRG